MAVQDVPTLHGIIDRQQATLNDIEDLCKFKANNRRSPTSGTGKELAEEILGMIQTWNTRKLDPNCPSCQCGGQLCTEHGNGKLETH